MKKYFILAAAALVALVACSKSPITTEAQSVDPDEVFAETDLYPITFSHSSCVTFQYTVEERKMQGRKIRRNL